MWCANQRQNRTTAFKGGSGKGNDGLLLRHHLFAIRRQRPLNNSAITPKDSCRDRPRTHSRGHLLTVAMAARTTASDWVLPLSFGGTTAVVETCLSSFPETSVRCTSEPATFGDQADDTCQPPRE
jgi:hypothetical protein